MLPYVLLLVRTSWLPQRCPKSHFYNWIATGTYFYGWGHLDFHNAALKVIFTTGLLPGTYFYWWGPLDFQNAALKVIFTTGMLPGTYFYWWGPLDWRTGRCQQSWSGSSTLSPRPSPHPANSLWVWVWVSEWSGSVSHRYGSPDPDPYQNVTYPEHCPKSMLTCEQLKFNLALCECAGRGEAMHMRANST